MNPTIYINIMINLFMLFVLAFYFKWKNFVCFPNITAKFIVLLISTFESNKHLHDRVCKFAIKRWQNTNNTNNNNFLLHSKPMNILVCYSCGNQIKENLKRKNKGRKIKETTLQWDEIPNTWNALKSKSSQ